VSELGLSVESPCIGYSIVPAGVLPGTTIVQVVRPTAVAAPLTVHSTATVSVVCRKSVESLSKVCRYY